LIHQVATYSKVNDCFISLKSFIVIYLHIHCHTKKYGNFEAFVYDSAKKKPNVKRNLIGYEQRKNECDAIANVGFPHLFLYLAGVISLSGYLPGSISREGDIASTQNLLFSFKPIICKLTYSHVINTDSNLFQSQ
jgi:hypothetical protein